MENHKTRLMSSALFVAILGTTVLQGCTQTAVETEDAQTETQVQNFDENSDATPVPAKTHSADNSEKMVPATLVTSAPVPDWVDIPALHKLPKGEIDFVKNGVAYLNLEDRVYVTATGYEYFGRMAYEVTERKGLESAGQISRSFDPSLGTMAFNFVRVTRDGKTIDRLPDLEISELRREDSLSDGLVDGDITALINIEDIRVGDIIDFGYSGETQTPLWPGHFFSTSSFSFSEPLAYRSYDISLPSETVLTTDTINLKLRPQISRADGRTRYVFETSDMVRDKDLNNVPEAVVTDSYVLMSTMQSWEDVSLWGAQVYDVNMSLPKDYSKTVKAVRNAGRTPEARMVAALRRVQDDIRYLGIESGVNSHKPRTPAVTLANGYGDCKDKSILLIALLREMGIEAHPALASISGGAILPQVLPSIGSFDHVIVQVKIGDKTYWLDPTISYQGGTAENLAVPDYGYALPLVKGQTDLTEILVPVPEKPSHHIKEHYVLREDGAMDLTGESVYRGAAADSMRRKFARTGVKAEAKAYLDYYADLYPGLTQVKEMTVNDDLEENLITVTEAYFLSAEDYEINEIDDGLSVKASSLSSKLPSRIETDRDIRLGLNDNTYRKHTITVKTPGRSFIAPESIEKTAHGVTFSHDYNVEGDVFTLGYTLKITESSAPLTQAREVVELADFISTQIDRTVYPKAARKSLSDRLGLAGPVSAEMENHFTEISILLNDEKNAEALEALNKLELSYKKSDPLRGYIQILRGAVLSDLSREAEAIKALDEAFSLYDPDTKDIYYTYASLLYRDDQDTEAGEVITRLFTKFPEAIKTIKYEWLWRLSGVLFRDESFDTYNAMLKATAQAQLKYIDDIDETDWAFESVIPIYVRTNDPEGAVPFLKYLKDPREIRDILIDIEMKPIWDEVEGLAGEGLRPAMKTYVAYTKEKALAENADFKVQLNYLYALTQAGSFDDAIAYGKEVLENEARVDAVGMDAYWFVGAYASALSATGDAEAADKVYTDLLEERLGNESKLVSQAINHIGLLVSAGKFERALKLIKKYEDDEAFDASDYGWMFLHMNKACIMAETGDIEAARALYADKTAEIFEDALGQHFLANICLMQEDEAAKILITRLESDRYRVGALPIFSTTREGFTDEDSYLAGRMSDIMRIANRDDVQAVFKKYGRSIEIDGPAEHWREW